MRIADFDFRPSLLPSIAFVLVLALLLSLGLWQLRRAGEKETLLLDREQRADQAAMDLNRTGSLQDGDRFRRATARGRYSGERQWLLDNRVMNGQPGYHVFSLFELLDRNDALLLVNRGWVSQGGSRQFLPDLPLPAREVELAGRMDRPASVGMRMGEAELDSLARLILVPYLDMEALERALGRPIHRFALVLDADQPGSLVRDWVRPEQITPEKHLGYAVQWFALALALSIIYVGVNSRRVGGGGDSGGARRWTVVDERLRNRRRAQFLLLAALFMAPVVAAWVAWEYMGSHGAAGTTNAGTLITPARSIESLNLLALDGRPLTEAYLRGRWTYVIFVPESGCGEECRRQLFYTRQVRTSVNKDMPRVQRLLVARRPPGEELAEHLRSEHEDLQVALAEPQAWSLLEARFQLGAAPAGSQRFYLVDPLANLMMAYDPGVPPKGVLKDLRKLLKISQIG